MHVKEVPSSGLFAALHVCNDVTACYTEMASTLPGHIPCALQAHPEDAWEMLGG